MVLVAAVVVSVSVDVTTAMTLPVTVTEVVVEVVVVGFNVVETVLDGQQFYGKNTYAVGVTVTVVVVNRNELQSDFAITGRVVPWFDPDAVRRHTARLVPTSPGKSTQAVVCSAAWGYTDFKNSSRGHAGQADEGNELHPG
jgi:hypothetical protein